MRGGTSSLLVCVLATACAGRPASDAGASDVRATDAAFALPAAPVGPEPLQIVDCAGLSYASDLPTDRAILYVSAGVVGGDGTRAHPFGTIADAIDAPGQSACSDTCATARDGACNDGRTGADGFLNCAWGTDCADCGSITGPAAGTVVAVGPGTYAEQVALPPGVSIWGTCPSRTVLLPPRPAPVRWATFAAGVLVSGDGSSEIRGLQIGTEAVSASVNMPGIIAMPGAGRVTIANVRIVQTTLAGVGLERETDISDLDVENVWSLAWTTSTGESVYAGMGWSLAIMPGTHVTARRMRLFGSYASASLYVRGAGTVVSVDDLQASAGLLTVQALNRNTDQGGGCVSVTEGAHLSLQRANLTLCREGAIAVSGPSRLDATDLTISNTNAGRGFGHGLEVSGGGTASITRAVIGHSSDFGLLAIDPGSSITATGVLIDSVAFPNCTGCMPGEMRYAAGAAATAGAMITLDDFLVRHAAGCGVAVSTMAGMTLSNGAVSENAVGVCADPSFDLSTLEVPSVRYVGNTLDTDPLAPISPTRVGDTSGPDVVPWRM